MQARSNRPGQDRTGQDRTLRGRDRTPGASRTRSAGQARDQVILSAQRPYRSTARRRPLGGLMQSWISKIWNSPSTALPGEQESNPAGGESNHLQLNRNSPSCHQIAQTWRRSERLP
eukprot:jgi/Tetstr1/455170/TSEL_042020.t1